MGARVKANTIIYWVQTSGEPTSFDPYTNEPIFEQTTTELEAWLERVDSQSSIEMGYRDARRDPADIILHGRLLCPKFMPVGLSIGTTVELDFNATATQKYRIRDAYLYPEAATGYKRPYKKFGEAIRVNARLESNPELSNWLSV